MVSMTDFLEILGVFGQEYPNSFFADSTKAVLDLGLMDATTCLGLAESTYNEWRMVTATDIYTSSHLIAELSAESDTWQYSNPERLFFWCWHEKTGYVTEGMVRRYSLSESGYDPAPFHYHVQSDTTQSYQVAMSKPYSGGNTYVQVNSGAPNSCFLITEVRPTIEYMECDNPECIEDALNNGWQPLGGRDVAFGFWRESE